VGKMLACPICGESRNVTKTIYRKDDVERENLLCLRCGRRSLIGHVRHLILHSANMSLKIKNCKVAINSSRAVFENGIVVEKVEDRFVAVVMGEPLLLTFGTRLSPKTPPYPLSLLK